MTLREQIDVIKMLTPSERVAGYIARSANLAELGARIRKNGIADTTWVTEDEELWGQLCDDIDPWFYAMSEAERAKIKPFEIFLAELTNATFSV